MQHPPLTPKNPPLKQPCTKTYSSHCDSCTALQGRAYTIFLNKGATVSAAPTLFPPNAINEQTDTRGSWRRLVGSECGVRGCWRERADPPTWQRDHLTDDGLNKKPKDSKTRHCESVPEPHTCPLTTIARIHSKCQEANISTRIWLLSQLSSQGSALGSFWINYSEVLFTNQIYQDERIKMNVHVLELGFNEFVSLYCHLIILLLTSELIYPRATV